MLLPHAAALVLVLAAAASADRPLTGRFLHITDIHPDPYYTPGTRVGEACHKASYDDFRLADQDAGAEGVDENDKRKAGKWGVGPSDCDTPLSLVDITFDWLEQNWADDVDFVIWTGDNARHDISRALPRSPAEIYDLNRKMVGRMHDVFGKRGVRVVPSLGNNDIWPHNIMYPGPNDITETFLDIWSAHIPSEQTHVFERGAYFTADVVPDRLAVVSLNTLFWYDSNKAVDGCPFDGSEPGSEQMEWLEVQLGIFRARGMQVWLSGHVPPSPGNYFPDCWFRFGELLLAFQDTVVGSVFGHMNVDHWFLVEREAVEDWRTNPSAAAAGAFAEDEGFNNATAARDRLASSLLPSFASLSSAAHLPPTSANSNGFELDLASAHCPSTDADANLAILKSRTKSGTLEGDLLRACERLPGARKTDLGAFAVVNVGPSVIPTYFPSVRVFSYNVTGEPFRQNQTLGTEEAAGAFEADLDEEDDEDEDEEDEDEDDASALVDSADAAFSTTADPADQSSLRKKKKRPKKAKKPHRPGDSYCRRHKHAFEPVCQPRKPQYVDARSPSRTNGFGTPLGYSQWFLPDVNDNARRPEYKLEYTTYEPEALVPPPAAAAAHAHAAAAASGNATTGAVHVHQQQALPIPLHLLPSALLSALLAPPPAPPRRRSLACAAADAADAALAVKKKYTPYRLKDLTLPAYLRLGRKLAADTGVWRTFMRHMFVSTGKEDDD